jgi:flavin reductase (DIM6/NTAB) family NADH-FMN oxidoreductase RutF
MSETTEKFDQRQLRDALGAFVTGVTVVTTRDKDGIAYGVTANSFSSVSLEPPLILWSLSLTSRSCCAFRDTDHFTVNILAEDQVDISNHFAKSQVDKFNGIAHRSGLGKVPVVDGAAAYLECVKVESLLVGDHMLYIGRVERIGKSSRKSLAFSGGKYMRARLHEACV